MLDRLKDRKIQIHFFSIALNYRDSIPSRAKLKSIKLNLYRITKLDTHIENQSCDKLNGAHSSRKKISAGLQSSMPTSATARMTRAQHKIFFAEYLIQRKTSPACVPRLICNICLTDAKLHEQSSSRW